MKKILQVLFLSFLFGSCASTLNGKYQKVDIKGGKKESKIYVNGKNVGSGSSISTKIERDRGVKQIKISTPGYKDQYFVHYQTKKSPLYILSVVPFGAFWFPIFSDFGPKAFNYDKTASTIEKPLKIEEKGKNQKYIFVKNTAFEIKENSLKVNLVKYKNLKKNKSKKFKELTTNDEKIEFDNSIFTETLNQVLIDYKYTDSTNSIFQSKMNSAYISATVKKIDINQVYDISARKFMKFYQTNTEIEWNFSDIYGQSLFKKSYPSKSGYFSSDYYKEDTILQSIKDAISASFIQFISNKEISGLLEISKESQKALPMLTLTKGNNVKSLTQALESTVTITSKSGHGSGLAVSSDGYIVTNFHVVANSTEKELKVIDNNGKEFTAKLIRQNELLDLALLKIDKSFASHFYLPVSKAYTVGEDIFVIGTPKSVELGQTLTKGIISAFREKDGIKLIQLDASINGGNSGGPLTSKDGLLYAVVNAKMSGFGVEGLGFSIPAELIKEALFLE